MAEDSAGDEVPPDSTAGSHAGITPAASGDEDFVRTIYGQRFLLLKRQIFAGALVDTARLTRKAPSTAAVLAKEDFFRSVGHDDCRHQEIMGAVAGPAVMQEALEAMPRFFRSMSGMRRLIQQGERPLDHLSHCGWWWCQQAESLAPIDWTGLTRAFKTLRLQRIDPWDVRVALVAVEWEEAEYRSLEATEAAQKALPAIEKLLSHLDGITNIALSVRSLQEELRRRLDNLRPFLPVGGDGGAPKDVGRRAALRAAEGFGFSPAVVAAISVLVCADPNGLDDFDRYRDAINETARRMRSE